MPIQVTYTEARANLAKLWDEVSQNRKTVIITRRGAENVVFNFYGRFPFFALSVIP